MTVETLNSRPDWAVVSAELSELSEAINAARSAALRAELDELGLPWYDVDGVWQGARESSVLILGVDDSTALRIARQWGQAAVLTGSALVYSDGTAEPVRSIEPGLGELGGSRVLDGPSSFDFHAVL